VEVKRGEEGGNHVVCIEMRIIVLCKALYGALYIRIRNSAWEEVDERVDCMWMTGQFERWKRWELRTEVR
jgi:hypothetical protein